MDPKEFPILSHLLSQIDQSSNPPNPEVERIALTQFPHLNNPKVASLLTQVIPTSLTQTHALLRALGPRPDPDVVSTARSRMTQVQELGGAGGGGGGGREEEKEVEIYRAAVRLEGIYEEHERQLRDVEERLVGAYREVVAREIEGSQVNEEVVAVLKEAQSGGVVERLDLSGRQLTLIPEAFGTLHGLFLLNLSHNQLQVLPDSIAGLELLEQLDISSNMLELLPDSIGLLRKLKVLNVSGNKLKALPESIALCSSLVELDASFNNLMSLPKNIGYGLMNLERLSIQLNKICFLPQSICEMKSLRYLDAHFNELRGLPHAIGRLITLEVLNVSSNFSDFTELPETIGDLTNLRELDLSNNQIRVLPYSFCRLQNLSKLNLDENPLIVPPKDVVNKGIEALREFMAKAWQDMIADEQRRSMQEANQQQPQSKWLGWGTSWLNNLVTGVSQGISGYLGGEKAPRDPYLDELL